jgi:MFS family permease
MGLSGTVSLIILAMLLATPFPFAIRAQRYGSSRTFVRNLAASLAIAMCIAALLAYWPHLYQDIRLEMLGVDTLGLDDAERVRNVAPENREEAIALYWSLMGVGWVLQAIFISVLVVPYQLVVWLAVFVVSRLLSTRGRVD